MSTLSERLEALGEAIVEDPRRAAGGGGPAAPAAGAARPGRRAGGHARGRARCATS